MYVRKRFNLGHALDQHPTAKEYLVRIEIKEEPIDQDNECMKGSVWDPPWNFKSPTPWGPRGFEIMNSPPHGAPGF